MRLEAPLDDISTGPSNVRVLRALYRLPAGLGIAWRTAKAKWEQREGTLAAR